MATNEELEQRIKELESLVISQYDPPSGPEYSFPVPGQPIDQDQFQLLSLHSGNGIIDRGDFPYELVPWPTDSETNQKNSMILKAGRNNDSKAESLVSGYYHVMSEDKVIPLDPVSETTTYHICITYDPRSIEGTGDERGNPVEVKVYDSDPPVTFGRNHVYTYKVTRKPNQLLTDATIERVRPRLAAPIYVWAESHKPDAASVLYGSLCVVGETASIYRSVDDSNEGNQGWVSITDPPWIDSTSKAYPVASSGVTAPGYRVIGNKVELRGRIKRKEGTDFVPGGAYNLIPNSPTPEVGTVMNAGSDNKREPIQVGRASGGTLEVQVKNNTRWVDLAGCFYYLK